MPNRKPQRKPMTRRKGVLHRRSSTDDATEIARPGITPNTALSKLMQIYESEGYRKKTMDGYRRDWEEFFRITGKMFVDEVNEQDFRAYIANLLKERGLSPVTVNIRISSLRAMYKRMEKEHIISYNPAAKIRKLRTDEKRLVTLNDNQVRRLFSVVETDTFPGFRDYVAMLTMLKCGLRINEINDLEIEDVHFDNGVIILPGSKNKSRKSRTVPMTKKVQQNIAQLVSEIQDYFGAEVTNVFTCQFGEALRYDRIRKRMDYYAKQAGLKGEVRASPHSLRHTFAVNYLRNRGDIRSLQMILGHSDLSTTQIYLDYTEDTVIEKYNEVSENDNLDV